METRLKVATQLAEAGVRRVELKVDYPPGTTYEQTLPVVRALLDMGIRSVMASSFGDIFYNNAAKNGLLCVKLPDKALNEIRSSITAGWAILSVDLSEQSVTHAGKKIRFEIEPHIKERLMSGMDDIALTTANYLPQIEGYEKSMAPYLEPRPLRA